IPRAVKDFKCIATEAPTIPWIGSPQGAVRLNTSTRTVEYFAGERGLPDDQVPGIGFESGGRGSETAGERPGGELRGEPGPLLRPVQERYKRRGSTATSELRVPGDLSTNQTVSTDNDGL